MFGGQGPRVELVTHFVGFIPRFFQQLSAQDMVKNAAKSNCGAALNLVDEMVCRMRGANFPYGSHCSPLAFGYSEHRVQLPRLSIDLFWSARLHRDPTNQWLRKVIVTRCELPRIGSSSCMSSLLEQHRSPLDLPEDTCIYKISIGDNI